MLMFADQRRGGGRRPGLENRTAEGPPGQERQRHCYILKASAINIIYPDCEVLSITFRLHEYNNFA